MENENVIEVIGGDNIVPPGPSPPNIPDESNPAKLFVGGLSWQTSEEKLREYFQTFGNVSNVSIIKDPLSQKSRGFGFITFSDPSSVEQVLRVPIHTLDEKKIDPKHATPKHRSSQLPRTKKIFVGGVSQETSAEEVRAYFMNFGQVGEVVLLMDQKTKRHRGFGFVTFENEDVVDIVCDMQYHIIKTKKVECKKAKPKEVVVPGIATGENRMMKGLGMAMQNHAPTRMVPPTYPLAAAHAHVQAHAAAAAAHAASQAQSAAMAGYGRLFGSYQPLAGYRYSPYRMPTMTAGIGVPPPAAPESNQAAAISAYAYGPYPGYNLANVDMSSFQGVDWSAMYGLGMIGQSTAPTFLVGSHQQ